MKTHTEKQALVSRILTFSCVDGPGNRLVIFLQGCNFNCLNCHNPHTINHCNDCGDCVAVCPTGALGVTSKGVINWDSKSCTQCDACIDACTYNSNPKVMRYTVTEILAVIRQHYHFLSGVTISGGEATLQLPFIVELFKRVKSDPELKHLTCFIDSNGELPLTGWDKVMDYLDGAMIDLKSWQQETHQWLVGRTNHRVVKTIEYLAQHDKLFELRLLHIPGRSDLDSEIEGVAGLINRLPITVQIRLNAFQHHGVKGIALTWPKCSKEQMLAFHALLTSRTQHTYLLPTIYT
ncbi:YjjW family glycine radical enzyme activase [Vibrio sinensis]